MAKEQGVKSTTDSKQSKEQAAGGGRSEKQAQQRDDEQAKAGHDKNAELPRGAAHNVKSEPHWDPAEAPTERDAKGGKSPA
jgi:hypothetical protein